MPALAAPAIADLAWPLAIALAWLAGDNAGWLWVLGVTATYLLYETLHFSYHLPEDHVVHRRLPGLRRLRALHQLHHRSEEMTRTNFNLTFPLTDWLAGTLKEPTSR